MLFIRPTRRYDSWRYFGQFLVKLARVLFIVSSITFVVYFWLENLKTGLISNYFDINLLILVSLGALLVLLVDPLFAKKETSNQLFYGQFLIKFLTVLGVGVLVKLSFPGTAATMASLLTMMAVVLLIYNLSQD